jgi:streptomycin 6-kinase
VDIPITSIDPGVRQRLTTRFGTQVAAWFDDLPTVLRALAAHWQLEFGPAIPRGSVSVVIRCTLADGRPAVLKVSPDRARLEAEAAALGEWATCADSHTPAVLAVDPRAGALLLEAIEPGDPLDTSLQYPNLGSVADLLTSLHTTGTIGRPQPRYPLLAHRVTYLFDSSAKLYTLHPELAQVVSPALYERGRHLAAQLAAQPPPTVLLHGDLTPSNLLDGGTTRGLVAIDPAPCLGDAAFDAVDLLLWQADDLATIEGRAKRLAAATGVDEHRLLAWCTAFAGMAALELACTPATPRHRIEAAVALANQAVPQ